MIEELIYIIIPCVGITLLIMYLAKAFNPPTFLAVLGTLIMIFISESEISSVFIAVPGLMVGVALYLTFVGRGVGNE